MTKAVVKELHPMHERTGLVPLGNCERVLVCIKCGHNFRLSSGGKAHKHLFPNRPSAFGRCAACLPKPEHPVGA